MKRGGSQPLVEPGFEHCEEQLCSVSKSHHRTWTMRQKEQALGKEDSPKGEEWAGGTG